MAVDAAQNICTRLATLHRTQGAAAEALNTMTSPQLELKQLSVLSNFGVAIQTRAVSTRKGNRSFLLLELPGRHCTGK